MLPLVFHSGPALLTVIGGGAVGQRKAKMGLGSGFPVRVVDPVSQLWPDVEWIAEEYQPHHLQGASLVVAAATPRVNSQVVDDARRTRIPVCDAANPEAGDFHFPAVVRRGPMTLAVSTGGASPILAKQIRDQLAEQFDNDFGQWVQFLGELRELALQTLPDATRRKQFLNELASPGWLQRLREIGPEAVRAEMLAALEAAQTAV